MTAEQRTSFAKFWKSYKEKVRARAATRVALRRVASRRAEPRCVSLQLVDAVKRELVWNNRLEKFGWRVDLKTKTRKSAEEINEPCAMVELNVVHGAQVRRRRGAARARHAQRHQSQSVRS